MVRDESGQETTLQQVGRVEASERNHNDFVGSSNFLEFLSMQKVQAVIDDAWDASVERPELPVVIKVRRRRVHRHASNSAPLLSLPPDASCANNVKCGIYNILCISAL